MKAFLSHSSADKHFVRQVFDYLTAARAHYDSVTFESFQTSFDAIRIALADSHVFVFFASPSSIESPWVREEVKIAVDPATTGKHLDRIVVLLGVDRDKVPVELAQSTAIQYSDPGLVARKIESLLAEKRIRAGARRIFIGREDDLKTISAGFIPIGGAAPEFIFISGIPGIGRKSVLARAIQDNFPFINQSLRVVPVSNGTSASDLYFSIRASVKKGTVSEYANEIGKFNALSEDAQLEELARLMSQITSERDPIVLDDGAWLITDTGELSGWFVEVLSRLPQKPFPQVVIVSARALSVSGRAVLSKRFFTYGLTSLPRPSSTRLLWLHINQSGISIDQTTLATLVDAVDGHPDQIVRAAQLIISGGSVGAEIRVKEVVEALNRSSESLIKLAELTTDQYLVVKLFNEFEYMSAEDISAAFGSPDRLECAFFPLLDYAFVERVNGLFRLAPSVSRALSRMADKEAPKDEFVLMRRAIAGRLSKIANDDLVDFDVLENSVAAWVRSNDADPPLLATKLLLPASLLRVARRAYDTRDWAAAAEFAGRALDGSWKLTDEAALEAYRVRGLSLARRDDPDFDALLAALARDDRFSGGSAAIVQRHIHFLRGFKARLDGDLDLARSELERIIKGDRRPGFNVLREYSAVLLKAGELNEALTYSRMALEVASSNPYVLSMVIDILDKKSEREGLNAELSAERQRLFGRLRRADESDRTSFSLLREARQFAREKDYKRALQLLDIAEQDRDVDPIVLGLERAQVLLWRGSYEDALKATDNALKVAKVTLGGRAVEYFAQIDEIRIRAMVEQGRADEAEILLRDAKRLNRHVREELLRLVSFAKMGR